MNLRKRAAQGTTVAIMVVALSAATQTVPAITVADETAVMSRTVTVETDLATNGNRTAGIAFSMDRIEEEALDSIEAANVNIAPVETTLVAAAEGETALVDGEALTEDSILAEASTAPQLSEEELLWQNRLMADVNEFLYVRATGDENAEIIGKLYKGDVADVAEYGDVWTHIRSGNVDGYVNNGYVVMGQEALAYAKANFDTNAEVLTDGLRIRSAASEEASIITVVTSGTDLKVDASAEAVDGWVPVIYGGTTRYVSAEHVSLELALGEAITIEEEQEELQRLAEEAAAAKASQITEVTTIQNDAVAASVDEVTLLAAIIQCEAGNECYEGQVAVGAVVMNRVRSGSYPSTIYDVIYQPSQFPPAAAGSVASIAASGPKASCLQAAQEALNGTDNTGGATHFRRASSGHAGVVIGNHVFY